MSKGSGGGRGGGGAALMAQVGALPPTDLNMNAHEPSNQDAKERERQLAELGSKFTSHEQRALESFVEGHFEQMRAAEQAGFTGAYAKEAKQLSRAIDRTEKKNQATMLYRGLSVDVGTARKLMKSSKFDTRATSFWSSTPDVAVTFGGGKLSSRASGQRIPVVIAGRIKGVAAEPKNGYGVESLVRSKTLRIVGREKYTHPKHGPMLVIRVSE